MYSEYSNNQRKSHDSAKCAATIIVQFYYRNGKQTIFAARTSSKFCIKQGVLCINCIGIDCVEKSDSFIHYTHIT